MQTATDTTFNLSLLLAENVARVDLLYGRSTYRMAKPTGANPLPDDMLRIYTDDGVAHTHRPWYNAIRIIYADGTHQTHDVPERKKTVYTPSVSLIPSGVRRIICNELRTYQHEGPIWFHYGGMIGLSEHEDIAKGFADHNTYTWADSHQLVLWWRDEPANSIFL